MFQLRQFSFYKCPETDTLKITDKPLVPDIVYKNLNDILSHQFKTPPHNVFVTLWHQSSEEAKRKRKVFGKQPLVLFDIDAVKQRKDELYRSLLAKLLGVDEKNIWQIWSGHGYHLVLELKTPIEDREFFKSRRKSYRHICELGDKILKEEGLTGKFDPQVFAPSRLLRFPGSYNSKDGGEPVLVELIKRGEGQVDLPLKEDMGSQKGGAPGGSHSPVDSEGIEKGCEFLKWAKSHQGEVTEAQWYAMLSIVSRLADGESKVHEYSKNHPDYNFKATQEKAAQAQEKSGPRTCSNIESMWSGCRGCAYYGKVKSPIQIKSEEFIPSENCGFHLLNEKGKPIPQYDDLRKHYQKNTPYINVSGSHYRFEATHWSEYEDVYIEAYAQEHMRPMPENRGRSEFKGLIKCTNLKRPEFFETGTSRKINLQNGVLNIDSMEFGKHSKKYGFKSVLPFDYDPEAVAPTFEEMLHNITLGRQELIDNLLEFMGYAISNDEPRADKILVLTGSGSNGKSRFLNVLQTLGGTGAKALRLPDLQKEFHLHQLNGALFNVLEEVPAFAQKDLWEILKGLSTGAMVTACVKFKTPYEFRNKAKFIMACNDLPKGASINDGYFRRLLVVPFEANFKRGDGNFRVDIDSHIIQNEMPGVLNAVLRAYKRLVAQDYQFTRSEVIEAAVGRYERDMDSVARFASEFIETLSNTIHENAHLLVSDKKGDKYVDLENLYVNYAQQCQRQGENPVSYMGFNKRLSRSNVLKNGKIIRIRVKGERRRVLTGYTPDDDESF